MAQILPAAHRRGAYASRSFNLGDAAAGTVIDDAVLLSARREADAVRARALRDDGVEFGWALRHARAQKNPATQPVFGGKRKPPTETRDSATLAVPVTVTRGVLSMDGYAICKDGRGEYTQVIRSAASVSILVRTLEVCAPKGSVVCGVVITSGEKSSTQQSAKFGF